LRRYYELLNAVGQRDAAQANFDNAETVRKAVDARLTVGLATLPDALEARAAAAQANFTLQAAIGDVDIRRGDLLSLLGAAPSERLQVQPLADPDHFDIEAYILASCAVLARTERERTQPGSNSPVKVKTSCTHSHNSLLLILIRGCDGKS
jgi:outer membrane protein TolC